MVYPLGIEIKLGSKCILWCTVPAWILKYEDKGGRWSIINGQTPKKTERVSNHPMTLEPHKSHGFDQLAQAKDLGTFPMNAKMLCSVNEDGYTSTIWCLTRPAVQGPSELKSTYHSGRKWNATPRNALIGGWGMKSIVWLMGCGRPKIFFWYPLNWSYWRMQHCCHWSMQVKLFRQPTWLQSTWLSWTDRSSLIEIFALCRKRPQAVFQERPSHCGAVSWSSEHGNITCHVILCKPKA